MDDINLHFTGDFHAISSAHALLAAMLDNHLQQGNALDIDPRRITWPRTIDMNDRALRNAVIGLGGVGDGVVREERWVIIPASEVMAIVALATSREDLEERLGADHRRRDGGRGAIAGARARPQGARARWRCCSRTRSARTSCRRSRAARRFVHAGPFGNIAHGCNSILATRAGARARRHRRDRSRVRLRPRRREVLRHQVPRRRAEAGGRGARRDRALAQDAGRRRQEGARRRRISRALERGLPQSRASHRERAAVRRARGRRAQPRSSPTPTPSCRW